MLEDMDLDVSTALGCTAAALLKYCWFISSSLKWVTCSPTMPCTVSWTCSRCSLWKSHNLQFLVLGTSNCSLRCVHSPNRVKCGTTVMRQVKCPSKPCLRSQAMAIAWTSIPISAWMRTPIQWRGTDTVSTSSNWRTNSFTTCANSFSLQSLSTYIGKWAACVVSAPSGAGQAPECIHAGVTSQWYIDCASGKSYARFFWFSATKRFKGLWWNHNRLCSAAVSNTWVRHECNVNAKIQRWACWYNAQSTNGVCPCDETLKAKKITLLNETCKTNSMLLNNMWVASVIMCRSTKISSKGQTHKHVANKFCCNYDSSESYEELLMLLALLNIEHMGFQSDSFKIITKL